MALLQRLIQSVLPKSLSDSIQAESESWVLRCPNCGTARSVWELGGVRFGAASKGKSTMILCATCGQLRLMPMERKDAA